MSRSYTTNICNSSHPFGSEPWWLIAKALQGSGVCFVSSVLPSVLVLKSEPALLRRAIMLDKGNPQIGSIGKTSEPPSAKRHKRFKHARSIASQKLLERNFSH
jgi:hypothetical protein